MSIKSDCDNLKRGYDIYKIFERGILIILLTKSKRANIAVGPLYLLTH